MKTQRWTRGHPVMKSSNDLKVRDDVGWSAPIDAESRDLHFRFKKWGLIRRFSGGNGFKESGDGGLIDVPIR